MPQVATAATAEAHRGRSLARQSTPGKRGVPPASAKARPAAGSAAAYDPLEHGPAGASSHARRRQPDAWQPRGAFGR
eukprot:2679676-Prymnesium_polylepis.2